MTVRVYSEKELADLGYVEVRPGIFERAAPKAAPAEKKVPNKYSKLKTGTYEIGGKTCHFRSGYELIYAQYLEVLKEQGQIKDWLFEPQRFDFPIKRGCNSYLPDFKILYHDGTHSWVETKGYLDPKGATKLKRFAKYYPGEKLELVRKDFIDQIKNSGIIGKQL